MKVGIFSPYLETLGGGERYILTVAEFFQNRGDQVDIFWKGDREVEVIKKRFNINLPKVNFIDDIFFTKTNLFSKLSVTRKYDLLYFLSDGSIPATIAKQNIIHFQVPFDDSKHHSVGNRLKLHSYKHIVCNSKFTKKYIDKSYGVSSEVIYPPVPVDDFSAGKKEKLILSVGRFVNQMHPKKHEVMIDVFKKSFKKFPGWQLILIGGTSGEDSSRVNKLIDNCKGYPIKILANCGFTTLRDYYSRAQIYWHAAGYGEDLEKFPARAEHFGMTTVEAMSAGCIPVVFAGGGQKEIITEGIDGFFWETTDELIKKTLNIINSESLQEKVSKQAVIRSKDFSKKIFFQKLEGLL